jgi:transposase
MPKNTPDLKMAAKVQDFRAKGLSFREIQKITGKDLKTLYRWNLYDVGKKKKLSTAK